MIKTLVLGSEDINIYYLLGALHRNNDIIPNIDNFYCSGPGSIVGLLISLGMSPAEINTAFWFTDVFNFYEECTNTLEILEQCVKDRLGFIPTMQQLKEITGRKLFLTLHNETTNAIEILSSKTVPEMLCTAACYFSSRKPNNEKKHTYCGNNYCDSILIQAMPIQDLAYRKNVLCCYTVVRDSKQIKDFTSKQYYAYCNARLASSCKDLIVCNISNETWKVIRIETNFRVEDPEPRDRISMSQSGCAELNSNKLSGN